MVLRFLSGMMKFIKYKDEELKTLCVKESPSSDIQEVTFDTSHWLFEAKDNDVITKLLGSSMFASTNLVHMTKTNTFDCFVLGCVSQQLYLEDYGIDGFHIGDDRVEMLEVQKR